MIQLQAVGIAHHDVGIGIGRGEGGGSVTDMPGSSTYQRSQSPDCHSLITYTAL